MEQLNTVEPNEVGRGFSDDHGGVVKRQPAMLVTDRTEPARRDSQGKNRTFINEQAACA